MDGGGNGTQLAHHLTIKYDNYKRLISAFWYDTFANSLKILQSNQAVTNFWSGILSPRPSGQNKTHSLFGFVGFFMSAPKAESAWCTVIFEQHLLHQLNMTMHQSCKLRPSDIHLCCGACIDTRPTFTDDFVHKPHAQK